jgi:hypothetical protein
VVTDSLRHDRTITGGQRREAEKIRRSVGSGSTDANVAGATRKEGIVMLLIAEVVLTVVAWKRGWGAKALRPLAVAFGGGLALGMLFGSVAIGLALLLDLAAVVALAIMAICAPERAEGTTATPLQPGPAAPYRSLEARQSLSPYGQYEIAARRS